LNFLPEPTPSSFLGADTDFHDFPSLTPISH